MRTVLTAPKRAGTANSLNQCNVSGVTGWKTRCHWRLMVAYVFKKWPFRGCMSSWQRELLDTAAQLELERSWDACGLLTC